MFGVDAGKSDIAEHSLILPSELEPTVFSAGLRVRLTHPWRKRVSGELVF
jgi:hypothetical protein